MEARLKDSAVRESEHCKEVGLLEANVAKLATSIKVATERKNSAASEAVLLQEIDSLKAKVIKLEAVLAGLDVPTLLEEETERQKDRRCEIDAPDFLERLDDIQEAEGPTFSKSKSFRRVRRAFKPIKRTVSPALTWWWRRKAGTEA